MPLTASMPASGENEAQPVSHVATSAAADACRMAAMRAVAPHVTHAPKGCSLWTRLCTATSWMLRQAMWLSGLACVEAGRAKNLSAGGDKGSQQSEHEDSPGRRDAENEAEVVAERS